MRGVLLHKGHRLGSSQRSGDWPLAKPPAHRLFRGSRVCRRLWQRAQREKKGAAIRGVPSVQSSLRRDELGVAGRKYPVPGGRHDATTSVLAQDPVVDDRLRGLLFAGARWNDRRWNRERTRLKEEIKVRTIQARSRQWISARAERLIREEDKRIAEQRAKRLPE